VFVGFPGKTLFARISDRRIKTYPTVFTDDLEPDVIVFPCSQPAKFDPTAIDLPQAALARLHAGRATIAFDASLEGQPHSPERTRMLHGVLERLGVHHAQAIYLTQDRGYEAAYGDYCARSSLQPRLAVLNYDFWIQQFFVGLEAEGEAIFERRLVEFERRSARRSRRFVSANWIPRPTKVLFLLSLMRDGLWDRGHISFGGFEHVRAHNNKDVAQLGKALRNLRGFEDMVLELAPILPRLIELGQIRLDPLGVPTPAELVGDVPFPAFSDSWFTVVTETEMFDRRCRITEKPFKALVNFQPIILLGNPASLDFIRDLGFETFPAFLDEQYDQELDPRRRFDLVYAQVKALCRIDEADLIRRGAEIKDQLVHNARWGLTKLPTRFRTEIDADLVGAIIRTHEQSLEPMARN